MKLYLINYKSLNLDIIEQLKRSMPKRCEHSFCYKQNDDYLRSMAGNYLLKIALGSEIDDKVEYLDNGKPIAKGYFFNISHDNEHVVLAVGDSEVGADIMDEEFYKNRDDIPEIFTEKEIEKSKEMNWNLLAFWTRKEAISKVMGRGITNGFKSIETSCLDKNVATNYFDTQIYVDTIKVKSLWISIASTCEINEVEVIEL